MTVILVGMGGFSDNRATLWGEPFPPDDIQALWNMITDDIIVQWSQGTATFFLQRADAPRRFGRTALEPMIIVARALEYDAWLQAIQVLLEARS